MNSHLKDKLNNYGVPPPARVWDNITATLDDDIQAEFPAKLYEQEVSPPPSAWNKITLALDQNIKSPQKRNPVIILRYAAAAVLVGIVAMISVWMVNKNTPVRSVGQKQMPVNSATGTSPERLQASSPTPTTPKTITGKSFLGEDRKWIARTDSKSRKIFAASTFSVMDNSPVEVSSNFSQTEFEEKAHAPKSNLGELSYDPSKISNDNPYILFLNPDGYVVRMSKKIVNMIGCMYNTADDNNPGCKEQIKKWRERIAQSPVTPSPGNFLDILELIKTIRDNYP